MIRIGDKSYYFKNTEDIMSLKELVVIDVYEVGIDESYAKIYESDFNIDLGLSYQGKIIYGEGTPFYDKY